MQIESAAVMTTTLEQHVRSIIASKLHTSELIPSDKTLLEIGFDSLGLSDLAETIDEHFNVTSPNRMLPGTLTVTTLINLIESVHQSQDDMQHSLVQAEAAD